MILLVLQRPRHLLPARFSRPVNPKMRSMVLRRSRRKKEWKREQWRRGARRFQRKSEEVLTVLRRWTLLLMIGFTLLLFGFLLFSPYLTVREIRITRSDPRLDLVAVQKSLAPLFGRHMLFLSARDAEELLRESVPDMETMELDKEYPGTLRVRLTLDPIIARLAIEGLAERAGAGAEIGSGSGAASLQQEQGIVHHYLTKRGAYAALPLPYQGTLPLVRIVDWGARPAPGKTLVSTELLAAMHEAEERLRAEFHQEVKGRTVFLRAREFHLQIAPHELWFDLQSPQGEHLNRYRAFLSSVPPGDVKRYVDLRIAGRVIYR